MNNAVLCLIALVLCASCSVVRDLKPVHFDPGEPQAVEVSPQPPLLQMDLPEETPADDTAPGLPPDSGFIDMLDQPLQVTFLNTSIETIFHSLTYDLPLEFVYPASFGQVAVSCDVALTTFEELEDFMYTLALIAGAEVTRRGNVYHFIAASVGGTTQGDGEATVPASGSTMKHYFLTIPSVFHQDAFASLAGVHGVACQNKLSLFLCSGSFVSIRRFKAALAGLDQQELHHRVVYASELSPADLLASLGLGDSVTLLPYKSQPDQYLAVSYSQEALDLLRQYLEIGQTSHCVTVEYRPVARQVQELQATFSQTTRHACGESIEQPGRLLVRTTDPAEDLRLLRQLDIRSVPLRFRLLILETSRSGAIAITYDNLKVLLTSLQFPGNFNFDVNLSGRVSSVRHIDLVLTESSVIWSNQQADRVEGAIAIQDGAQVRSVDTRNVGLSVTLTAKRLREGLRGSLVVSDSILANNIVISVGCSGEVLILPGEAVEVCRSFQKRSEHGVGFTGLSVSSSVSEYRVYAWIVADHRYKAPRVFGAEGSR